MAKLEGFEKVEINFSLIFCWQNDELRRKLGDFEKVNKVQSSLNDHTTALEQELKQLRTK